LPFAKFEEEEREKQCVCESEREKQCVCEREREKQCVCVCVCVSERERERERERRFESFHSLIVRCSFRRADLWRGNQCCLRLSRSRWGFRAGRRKGDLRVGRT